MEVKAGRKRRERGRRKKWMVEKGIGGEGG